MAFTIVLTSGVLALSTPGFAFAENETNVKDSIVKPSAAISNIVKAMKTMNEELEIIVQEKRYEEKLEQIKTTAEQYLGVPYVWGGTTPSGFDCSGFVRYVYGECGIELPRTTYSQIYMGERVDLDDLMRGDLLFWGSYHVGIYLGDGQFIHSPNRGRTVSYDYFGSYKSPTSARRLIFK